MTNKRFQPNLEILEQRDNPSGAMLMPDGTLLVSGTSQSDYIRVSEPAGQPGQVVVNITTAGVLTTQTFTQSQVKYLVIIGGNGNDTITNATAIRSTIIDGNGNDTIYGGSSNDVIIAGKGDDTINGGGGHDHIIAGGDPHHDHDHHHRDAHPDGLGGMEHINALIAQLQR